MKRARFGGGRGRWLAELFMLVNPKPKEKKKKKNTSLRKGEVGHCSSIDMNFIFFCGWGETVA